MKRRICMLGMCGLTSLATIMACGSDAENEAGDDDEGGVGSSGAVFVDGRDGSSGGGGDGGGGGNCSAPVDMYIMFDRSGSMGDDCNIGSGTNSKWCRGVNALAGYFSSQGAATQAAALQFFPQSGHTDSLCATGEGYHVSAVPSAAPFFQELPSNGFDSVLNSARPEPRNTNGLGTPTEAAIRGITRFTDANRRGGRVTIGILITDGNPNGCNEDLAFLSGLLQAHHQATQVRTYVIGMEGASFDNVEAIAQGGNSPEHPDTIDGVSNLCGNGRGPCRHWNVGDGDPLVFGTALKAIQESADGCKEGGGFVNPVK